MMNGLYSPRSLTAHYMEILMCACIMILFVRLFTVWGEPLCARPPASMFSVDLLVTMDRLGHSRRPAASLKETLHSKLAKSVSETGRL